VENGAIRIAELSMEHPAKDAGSRLMNAMRWHAIKQGFDIEVASSADYFGRFRWLSARDGGYGATHAELCAYAADKWVPVTFYLPPDVIGTYDDPSKGIGDEGWAMADLEASIRENGFNSRLWVAKSRYEMEENDDRKPYAFNGNHRLDVAVRLGVPFVPCTNADDAEDAVDLTLAEIEAMGGKLVVDPEELKPTAGPGLRR